MPCEAAYGNSHSPGGNVCPFPKALSTDQCLNIEPRQRREIQPLYTLITCLRSSEAIMGGGLNLTISLGGVVWPLL